MLAMDLASLLAPFIAELSAAQLAQISTYIDILFRWNRKLNLTAVRRPEEIVTRHFGESLFAARRLFPSPLVEETVIDVGSGAGFPGLPLKIYAPQLRLTLVESQARKATFLKEVARALELRDVEVIAGRAEELEARGQVVTLRAVERYQRVLPVAARLVVPTGRLALLVGAAQAADAAKLLPGFRFQPAVPIPLSARRILLVGVNHGG